MLSHEKGTYVENEVKTTICEFCGKDFLNLRSLGLHRIRCCENPNKKDIWNKGLPAWNKGLSTKTDERVAKGHETWRKNYELGKFTVGGKLSDESRAKLSETCRQKALNGEWHTSVAKKHLYKYNDNIFHGSWELLYALFLEKNKISWVRNKSIFKYFENGKQRSYTPDFYLVDSDEYVEIKGYETELDKLKWFQFPKDKNLLILREKELKKLGVFDLGVDILKYKLHK